MKNTLFILVLTILGNHFLWAQDTKFIARGNLSVGTNYESLDYNGGLIVYSPGGGIGLEIGLERNLVGKLAAYLATGYQQNLAFQSENTNGFF